MVMRSGIDPKVDYAFQRLFNREQNRPLLLHLLNAVLMPHLVRVTEVQLLNPFSDQDTLDDKLSIVDVKARDQNGRQFHVEMQILAERAFRSRVLFYWAQLHQQQLQEGDPYHVVRPTISICFTNFVLFPDVADHVLAFEVLNRAHQVAFSQDFLLYTLELPKFRLAAEQLRQPLDQWLYFLRHGETLDSTALPSTLDTPEMHRALEELTVLSQNDLERERYLARVKMQRDELSRLHSAREDGLEAGREEGLLKGQWIGAIHTYQSILQKPLTPHERLLALPPADLEQLAQQLKTELAR
jgi:predicted transposase/invertase (TIGR01784 family)